MPLQTKCVRYYMVFDRALGVMRRVLAAEGKAYDANNAEGERRWAAQPAGLGPYASAPSLLSGGRAWLAAAVGAVVAAS